MEHILEKTPGQLAGVDFLCSCGRRHQVGIREIHIENGCLSKLPALLQKLNVQKVFLMADENTMKAAGNRAAQCLHSGNILFHSRIFKGSPVLVPNEYAVGSALAAMEPDDGAILAVGSGSLNDTARFLSARTGLPYIIVATAPSMDGYASTVSPLILDGMKITKEAVYPAAIFAEPATLRDAPMPMLTAGLGDILGKYTALADWRLARDIQGEYYCEESVALMQRAVEKCAQNARGLQARDELSVQYIMEALVLAGIAMGLVGNSRPASGAEHHFAHFWEVSALSKGEAHPLHGNAVGVAAVICAGIYHMAADSLPPRFSLPDKDCILHSLQDAGACVSPKELEISRELFFESVLHAMEIRERFTILRFVSEQGLLPAFAQKLTEDYYGTGEETVYAP